MNTLHSYNKTNKFSSIFKKAYGTLDSVILNYVIIRLKMIFREIQRKCFKKNGVKLVNLQLDFLDILPSIDSKRFNDIMYDQDCCYYTNNKYTCWETDLEEEIENAELRKKHYVL